MELGVSSLALAIGWKVEYSSMGEEYISDSDINRCIQQGAFPHLH